jgi:hypothetical protein
MGAGILCCAMLMAIFGTMHKGRAAVRPLAANYAGSLYVVCYYGTYPLDYICFSGPAGPPSIVSTNVLFPNKVTYCWTNGWSTTGSNCPARWNSGDKRLVVSAIDTYVDGAPYTHDCPWGQAYCVSSMGHTSAVVELVIPAHYNKTDYLFDGYFSQFSSFLTVCPVSSTTGGQPPQ